MLWLLLLSSGVSKWQTLTTPGSRAMAAVQLLLSSGIAFLLLFAIVRSGWGLGRGFWAKHKAAKAAESAGSEGDGAGAESTADVKRDSIKSSKKSFAQHGSVGEGTAGTAAGSPTVIHILAATQEAVPSASRWGQLGAKCSLLACARGLGLPGCRADAQAAARGASLELAVRSRWPGASCACRQQLRSLRPSCLSVPQPGPAPPAVHGWWQPEPAVGWWQPEPGAAAACII